MTSQDAFNAAIEEFRTSKLGAAVHDKKTASGKCKPTAIALFSLFTERDVEDARLYNLSKGYDEHWIVRVGDSVVDPTQRQFDEVDGPESDVPTIAEFEGFVREWDEVVEIDFNNRFQQLTHFLPDNLPEWETTNAGFGRWSDLLIRHRAVDADKPTPTP